MLQKNVVKQNYKKIITYICTEEFMVMYVCRQNNVVNSLINSMSIRKCDL